MKLTKDLKELIRRKLVNVQNKKEKNNRAKIQKELIPFSEKLKKLNKEIDSLHKKAGSKAKILGASSISLYSNRDNYICLDSKNKNSFDIDEEYFKILEEIEIGNDANLKEIFKRIDNM